MNADDHAALVYDEPRRIAASYMRRERGQTLQATALVNEAYMRLAGAPFTDRNHFIGVAARSMRLVLVDRARARGAQKRWAGLDRVSLTASALRPAQEAWLLRCRLGPATHSGICTIYALEEIGQEFIIVAEYIDGRSLRDEFSTGRRPSGSDLLQAARERAAALAAAHARGITHRDLKPENVMRSMNGSLKILDFGLALMDVGADSPGSPRVTNPGSIIGTSAYMAPEQINHGVVDARTDLFALGVDLTMAAVLVVEGLWVSPVRPIRGALMSGLGLSIALARLVLERSTTPAVFDEPPGTT